MSILRVVKKVNHYTQIYNTVFEDRRLSYGALGLLSYLLSKPANWQVIVADLIRDGRAGRDRVRSYLKELETACYMRRYPKRDESGKVRGWSFEIYEEPYKVDPTDVKTDRRETRPTVKRPLVIRI